jgi:hypothetical protein
MPRDTIARVVPVAKLTLAIGSAVFLSDPRQRPKIDARSIETRAMGASDLGRQSSETFSP